MKTSFTKASFSKASFFKDYIIYRMKGLFGFFVTSCVLCLISGPMPLTIMCISASLSSTPDNPILASLGAHFSFYGVLLSLYAMILSIPAILVLAAIMPAATRRHLNRRSYVDTFGALPLTYKQRYWGDLLAEIAAYVTPIIPAGIYTCIMMAVLANIHHYEEYESFTPVLVSIFFTLLLCAVGAIALSGFMAQCCGKAGSGVLYTFIVGLVIPLLVIEYVNIIENNALGIKSLSTAIPACSVIPPFGPLFAVFKNLLEGNNPEEYPLAVNSPITLIVMLVIIAAWIIGGYYLGKIRKAELVGERVLFKPVSLIISVVAAWGILGIFFGSLFESDKYYTIIVLVATFIIFMVFELITKRRSIKVLKSIIIYVCSAAAVLGFTALVHFTDSFGIGNYVPNVNSVREISIESRNSYSIYELEFNDKQAMQIIIDGHKKLLNSKDKLYTGGGLEISYKLKNGSKISRGYYSNDDTFFDEFLGEVLLLPQSGTNYYTVLANDDIELNMSAYCYSDIMGDEGYKDYKITPEKTDELRKLLYEDISDNYYQFIRSDFGEEYFAEVYVDFIDNGQNQRFRYIVPLNYKRTIGFLSDPANLTVSAETNSEFSINDRFRISYEYDGVNFNATFSEKTENPIPEELYNLLTQKEDGVEYSERFEIYSYGENHNTLYIKKSDEKRACEILFKALENYKSDNTEFYFIANTTF